jgi:prolyl 4-hydroxylase
MGTITHLSAEWEQWIVHNLSRAVPAAALVEGMVKNNFDLSFAMSAVAQRVAAPIAEAAACTDSPRNTLGNRIEFNRHTISVVTRIDSPHIAVLDHVLTDAECDALIDLSRPKLSRSTIVDSDTGAHEIIEARSSEGTFFLRGENSLVAGIEERLSRLTGMPIENGEGLQILHYGIAGEYKPHFDFFAPELAGSAAHMQKGGQRVSTLIMYLNDVDAGGETIFPDIGLAVSARKGSGVYFTYCDTQGNLDRRSLHGGAPVKSGEKWIATHWLRQGPYR